MSKSQNRGLTIMKRQENMTPHKVNNHTTKDLMDGEMDAIPTSKLKKNNDKND
jgi:hypothetical protein